MTKTIQELHAYEKGRRARIFGRKSKRAPYRDPELLKEFQDGWTDADKEIRRNEELDRDLEDLD